jgi:hypothetical protein
MVVPSNFSGDNVGPLSVDPNPCTGICSQVFHPRRVNVEPCVRSNDRWAGNLVDERNENRSARTRFVTRSDKFKHRQTNGPPTETSSRKFPNEFVSLPLTAHLGPIRTHRNSHEHIVT